MKAKIFMLFFLLFFVFSYQKLLATTDKKYIIPLLETINLLERDNRSKISYDVLVNIEEKIQHAGEDKRKIYVQQLGKLLQKIDEKTNTYQLISTIKDRVTNVKKIPIGDIDKDGKGNTATIIEWYQKQRCEEGYLPTATEFVGGKIFFGTGVNPLVYENIYILGTVKNVGDLDNDKVDEIILTDNRCRSNWSFFSLYSYKKGVRKKIGDFNVFRGTREDEGQKNADPYEGRIKVRKGGLVEVYEDGWNSNVSDIVIRKKVRRYKVEGGDLKLIETRK